MTCAMLFHWAGSASACLSSLFFLVIIVPNTLLSPTVSRLGHDFKLLAPAGEFKHGWLPAVPVAFIMEIWM